MTILTAHKCPQNFKKKVVLLHILLDNDIPNAVLEILENSVLRMFSFKPETVNKYIVPLYLTRMKLMGYK